jgi:hypothetical protein
MPNVDGFAFGGAFFDGRAGRDISARSAFRTVPEMLTSHGSFIQLNAFQIRFLTAFISFKSKIGNPIITVALKPCRVVPYNTGFIFGPAGPAKPYLLAVRATHLSKLFVWFCSSFLSLPFLFFFSETR